MTKQNIKLTNGFKFNTEGQLDAIGKLTSYLRKQSQKIADDTWKSVVLNVSTSKYDIDTVLGDDTNKNYIAETQEECINEMKLSSQQNRHSFINIGASIYFAFIDETIYGFLYTDNVDMYEALLAYDNVEQEADESEVWFEICDSAGTDIPNEAFLSNVIVPHKPRNVSYSDDDDIISYDERVKNCSRDAVLKNYQDTLEKKYIKSEEDLYDTEIGQQIYTEMFAYNQSDEFKEECKKMHKVAKNKIKETVTIKDLRGANE